MPDLVFCRKCKHLDIISDGYIMGCATTIIPRIVVNNEEAYMQRYYGQKPYDKNKNNDCPDFTPKTWERIIRWWCKLLGKPRYSWMQQLEEQKRRS